MGRIKGIYVHPSYTISHILFVYDILVFYEGSKILVEYLNDILNILCKSIGMLKNKEKSSLITLGLSEMEKSNILEILSL